MPAKPGNPTLDWLSHGYSFDDLQEVFDRISEEEAEEKQRQRDIKTGIDELGGADYGVIPSQGTEYWTVQHPSNPTQPGIGANLAYSDYFEASAAISKAGGDGYDTGALLQEYKSRFLDELYGNDRDATLGEGEDPADAGALARGESTHLWGLHLRRVLPPEDMDIRSDEYYEHITKADVDWGSYRNDKVYQKAFKDLGYDLNVLGQDELASEQQIRHAGKVIADTKFTRTKYDPSASKHSWKGKYDPNYIVKVGKDLYIDGQKQTNLADQYAKGAGRLQIKHEFAPLAQATNYRREVIKPDLTIPKIFNQKLTNEQAGIPTTMGST